VQVCVTQPWFARALASAAWLRAKSAAGILLAAALGAGLPSADGAAAGASLFGAWAMSSSSDGGTFPGVQYWYKSSTTLISESLLDPGLTSTVIMLPYTWTALTVPVSKNRLASTSDGLPVRDVTAEV